MAQKHHYYYLLFQFDFEISLNYLYAEFIIKATLIWNIITDFYLVLSVRRDDFEDKNAVPLSQV